MNGNIFRFSKRAPNSPSFQKIFARKFIRNPGFFFCIPINNLDSGFTLRVPRNDEH